MEIYTLTDIGRVRHSNQDAVDGGIIKDNIMWAVLCDGMGGANGGNVASETAVQTVKENIGFFDPKASEYQSEIFLTGIVEKANSTIYHKQRKDESLTGMGTTIVAAMVKEEEAFILNEGDSRAYHINQDGIVQITRDHSLVEDMVERGELTREQARNHPHKNLITRALGAEPVLLADSFRQIMEPGDYLLLCSDGLSNVVTDQEILYEVIHGGSGETCCERLLEIALHRGAPDNVTVVLVRC